MDMVKIGSVSCTAEAESDSHCKQVCNVLSIKLTIVHAWILLVSALKRKDIINYEGSKAKLVYGTRQLKLL